MYQFEQNYRVVFKKWERIR